ncbi:MAG: hypothetical protein AAGF96_17590 [Bacteroidota bacterium]
MNVLLGTFPGKYLEQTTRIIGRNLQRTGNVYNGWKAIADQATAFKIAVQYEKLDMCAGIYFYCVQIWVFNPAAKKCPQIP